MDLNNLPQVRNIEQLRSVMEEIGKEKITDDNLIWFACVVNAEALADANLRELGTLFRRGITPMTMEGVQELIDSYFEDDEEYHEESNRSLLASIARFCGKYELSSQLLEDEDEDDE